MAYGFLPYWSDPTDTPWDRLTHVACFSAELNGDGTLGNARGWPWTGTINAARSNGVRVHLTVTNFSPSDLLGMLDSPSSRTRAIDTIVSAADSGGADGVCLDFEGVTTNGWAALLPPFVEDLRAALRAVDPDAEVVIAVPAVNYGDRWPLASLAAVSDYLFLMGYDYRGPWSSTTGPSAPLLSPGLSVTRSLDEDYGAVIVDYPDRLLLGMPLYGNTWRTSSAAPNAAALDHISSTRLFSVRDALSGASPLFDAESQTPFLVEETRTGFTQTWYDDERSIGLKIDAAEDRRLGGIGFWALGYASPDDPVWQIVAEASFESACRRDCLADITSSGANPGEDGFGVPDGNVDVADLTYFVELWLSSEAEADLTTDGVNPGTRGYGTPDGVVSITDLTFYVEFWITACTELN
ncbi:MAG: glycoside hydrolase family 18 protein [Planctomycetota bacterium]